MSTLQDIMAIVIAIGLILIPIVPPLLVLRGQRFWAPWTMLGAVVFFALTLGSYIGTQIYFSQRMHTLFKSLGGDYYLSPQWTRLSELMEIANFVGTGLMVLSFLVYTIGLLEVAKRWKAISSQAKELEAKTAELAVRRDAVGG